MTTTKTRIRCPECQTEIVANLYEVVMCGCEAVFLDGANGWLGVKEGIEI